MLRPRVCHPATIQWDSHCGRARSCKLAILHFRLTNGLRYAVEVDLDRQCAEGDGYSFEVANNSYEWYRKASMKARRYHRLAELSQILGSALIPLSAVLWPGNTTSPAVLGAFVVVVTGLRSSFHWHDDYLRFNQAREAVEAERRLYLTHAAPYDDVGTRDQVLAKSITTIEQREMGSWLKVAAVPQSQPLKRAT
ncbi:DUF4231 domain-containing protein [Nocardia salmonicida]|uniref:DUF4231 domain-containing protein n=1 Tax=Nocardia salmonicida TaxID=53431 RepID=UPI00369512BA